LANIVYGEDQLAAHSAYAEARTSSFKVAYSHLCCPALPGKAMNLVFGATPAIAAKWGPTRACRRRSLLVSSRSLEDPPELACLKALNTFRKLIGNVELPIVRKREILISSGGSCNRGMG
jgi:hypothetical protein